MIANLRKKESFGHNRKANKGSPIQLQRSIPRGTDQTVRLMYKVCSSCNSLYSKTVIQKHLKKFADIWKNKRTVSMNLQNLAIGNNNCAANIYLRNIVVAMKDDELLEVIRNDPLTVTYANAEAYKYHMSSHHDKRIRSELRSLARIVIHTGHWLLIKSQI